MKRIMLLVMFSSQVLKSYIISINGTKKLSCKERGINLEYFCKRLISRSSLKQPCYKLGWWTKQFYFVFTVLCLFINSSFERKYLKPVKKVFVNLEN